eukprot:SAG31_NODE_2319_length_5944_cov_9.686056_7_plen_194_part_00
MYIWGQQKHLRLGFGKDAGADAALDDVLVAVSLRIRALERARARTAPTTPTTHPARPYFLAREVSVALPPQTNDVLLVQRAESQLGVTWRDWRTMVGFIHGDAHVQLEELTGHAHPAGSGCAVTGGCCAAVKQFSLPSSPHAFQHWRWEIESTHDGSGSTICYIGFDIGGKWQTDPSWQVSAASHIYRGGGQA